MAHIISFQPKIHPRLPVEVCENIIDMLAGPCNENSRMSRRKRKSLNNCRLVCRDWVPRCRFYLFDEVSVYSRDSLQAVATFLRTSSFHADRVSVLKIYGGGPDQSWISTVPLSLPKLRRLRCLDLVKVDFLQQPPHFYQVYSYLRTTSQSKIFDVYVDEDFLRAMPAKVSTLAALLRVSEVRVNPGRNFPVHTLAEATSVQSWRQKLTRRTHFATRGSLQELRQLLPAWTFPVSWWEITIQTSIQESLGELLQETRRVWDELARILTLSLIARPGDVGIGFHVEGLGTLSLGPVEGRDPVEYGLWANLDNADNSALAYLARVLPHLASCNLVYIMISVKKSWSASTETWQMVDDALLSLAQSTSLSFYPDADTVPLWKTLPYKCSNEISRRLLPKCTAKRIICRCGGQSCRLHDPKRWRLQTHGTLQDLLAILSAWTCPVKRWEITTQTSVPESLGEFSEELQKVWKVIAHIFTLSLVVRPRGVRIVYHVVGLGKLVLCRVQHSDPVKYGLWAKLDNADDSSLTYLARILPCMASCNLTLVRIQAKNGWSASTHTWQIVDDALLALAESTVSRVIAMVDPDADVPSWKDLPYECEDDLCKEILPRCTARGVVHLLCEKVPTCRLHSSKRCNLQTHETLRDLLEILPAWTSPVCYWDITMQTSIQESLGELSQETRRVWDELARVFALSITARPGDVVIEFHVEGLGTLTLGPVEDSEPVEYGLWAYLDNADDNALTYLAHILPCVASCKLNFDLRVKSRWSARTELWQLLDDALLLFAQSTLSSVFVRVDPDVDVPSWEDLSYECEDDLCKVVLPRCVAGGIVCLYCENSRECILHDPQRRHRGIVEEMENGGEGSSDNPANA